MRTGSLNRRNLKRLAMKLESLPKNYKHFNMGNYLENHPDEATYAVRNGGLPCGTVACALGHGPSAGVPVHPDNRFVDGTVIWTRYTNQFVPYCELEETWLFAGDWTSHDNHHWGAAARIRYLLDKGVPENFGIPSRHWRKVYEPYRITAPIPLPDNFMPKRMRT